MAKSSVSAFPKSNALVKELSVLLANSYLLKLKTHGYHWNVEGKDFFGLHQAFMTQYTELEAAVDTIAERIRALGAYAPASYKEYVAIAGVKEVPMPKDVAGIAKDLLVAHESLIKQAKKLSADAAEASDSATQALADDRTAIHEKTVWMLKSFLR